MRCASFTRRFSFRTGCSASREIRNLMLKSFSPRALAPVADRVRARTSRLISEAVERGEFDFATDIADHIPINTIGDLMDVPPADRPKLVDWNNQTLSRHSSQHSELEEFLARNEILLYFSALAQERRRNPGDDVISTLATGEVDGEPLSEDEIVFNCYSLILGADESSRMSSIGGILALARYDEQWRALKDATVSVDTAVEEVLRWTTPAMHFGRRAVVDAQIGDTPVAAGDIVTLWNSSANFDEEVFADSLRFDLARTPNKHVAFGYGPHFCLGAFLGRAHVGAVLHALREQVRTACQGSSVCRPPVPVPCTARGRRAPPRSHRPRPTPSPPASRSATPWTEPAPWPPCGTPPVSRSPSPMPRSLPRSPTWPPPASAPSPPAPPRSPRCPPCCPAGNLLPTTVSS